MKRICKWKDNSNATVLTGSTYYLNTSNGNDSNNGLSSDSAFLTQLYAESIMQNGDVLLPSNISDERFPKTSQLQRYLKEYTTRYNSESFMTTLPNLDIRHSTNFTGPKRGKKRCYELTYWGSFKEIINGRNL